MIWSKPHLVTLTIFLGLFSFSRWSTPVFKRFSSSTFFLLSSHQLWSTAPSLAKKCISKTWWMLQPPLFHCGEQCAGLLVHTVQHFAFTPKSSVLPSSDQSTLFYMFVVKLPLAFFLPLTFTIFVLSMLMLFMLINKVDFTVWRIEKKSQGYEYFCKAPSLNLW